MNLNEMRSVLDSLPVSLLVARATDGAICYANWAAAGLFEQSPEALIGTAWPQAPSARGPDGAPLPLEQLPLWRSLHHGETLANVEMWLELPSGTRHALLVSSAPLRDRRGRLTGALVVYRDVSQLKALQEMLTRLNGHWQDRNGFVGAILQQAPMPVAVLSYPEPRFLLLNDAYRRALGAASIEALLGKRLEDAVPEARTAGLVSQLEAAVRQGATRQVSERRPQPAGEAYWNCSYTPLRDSAGEVDRILEVRQNVTTQVMAQRRLEAAVAEGTRQLEAQRRQLEALVVAGLALSAERSTDGVLQRLSEAARDLLHARQAMLRLRATDTGASESATPLIEPEVTPSARSIGQALREILGTEGAAPYADLLAEEEAPSRAFLKVPVICRGQVFGQLEVTEKQDAGEFSDTDEVLAVGLAAQAAVAMENVRLFEDLGKQQERLLRAERLSAIGTFAGGIAHDLRQPLNVLKLNLQLLRQSKTPRSEAEERSIQRMEQQVDQAARIIQDLLALARQEPPQLTLQDLGAIVDQAVAVRSFPPGIEPHVTQESPLSPVPADAGQIRQVLDNLIDNAVQAMAERPGALTFSLQHTGDWAEIAVQDAGAGIPSDQLPRIFEPLFTTRRHGTGLGLTLCQRIVGAHGGEIDVESEEGVGTRVVIRLPVPEESKP